LLARLEDLVRKLLAALSVAVLVAIPSLASARQRMGGQPKLTVLFGAYAIQPTNRGDTWVGGQNVPSRWVIQHCTTVFESTVRTNWAVEYATGYQGRCRPVASNGLAVLKIERWSFSDGTSGLYWTPVTEFDGSSASCFVSSYKDQPRMPWDVVDDLFRIHCPTQAFGSP
jgi:hypothetical protein